MNFLYPIFYGAANQQCLFQKSFSVSQSCVGSPIVVSGQQTTTWVLAWKGIWKPGIEEGLGGERKKCSQDSYSDQSSNFIAVTLVMKEGGGDPIPPE
jgi:hypothetical protein